MFMQADWVLVHRVRFRDNFSDPRRNEEKTHEEESLDWSAF